MKLIEHEAKLARSLHAAVTNKKGLFINQPNRQKSFKTGPNSLFSKIKNHCERFRQLWRVHKIVMNHSKAFISNAGIVQDEKALTELYNVKEVEGGTGGKTDSDYLLEVEEASRLVIPNIKSTMAKIEYKDEEDIYCLPRALDAWFYEFVELYHLRFYITTGMFDLESKLKEGSHSACALLNCLVVKDELVSIMAHPLGPESAMKLDEMEKRFSNLKRILENNSANNNTPPFKRKRSNGGKGGRPKGRVGSAFLYLKGEKGKYEPKRKGMPVPKMLMCPWCPEGSFVSKLPHDFETNPEYDDDTRKKIKYTDDGGYFVDLIKSEASKKFKQLWCYYKIMQHVKNDCKKVKELGGWGAQQVKDSPQYKGYKNFFGERKTRVKY
jgi:hypothetical protein